MRQQFEYPKPEAIVLWSLRFAQKPLNHADIFDRNRSEVSYESVGRALATLSAVGVIHRVGRTKYALTPRGYFDAGDLL